MLDGPILAVKIKSMEQGVIQEIERLQTIRTSNPDNHQNNHRLITMIVLRMHLERARLTAVEYD